MKCSRAFVATLLLAPLAALHAADVPQSPMQVWADYNPNKGDFKEEIISEETKDGIYNREFYISAYVLGEDVCVYCKYSVKAGVTKAPGLLNDRCNIPDGRGDLIDPAKLRFRSRLGHRLGHRVEWHRETSANPNAARRFESGHRLQGRAA